MFKSEPKVLVKILKKINFVLLSLKSVQKILIGNFSLGVLISIHCKTNIAAFLHLSRYCFQFISEL
jgi:hypothetical protein